MQTGTPEAKWLQTSQIRMKYLDWGRPAPHPGEYDDTVILALHGLASSSKWYDLVLPHLSGAYHCISLDQRGHGETDQPPTGYDWRSMSSGRHAWCGPIAYWARSCITRVSWYRHASILSTA